MRLTVTKTGSTVTYYIIRSVNRNGKRFSEVVKRLGTEEEIRKMGVEDPVSWVHEQLEIMNQEEQKAPEKAIYMQFREDESRARKDNSAENLNVLRHMTFNLLKTDTSLKGCFSDKQFKCLLDDQYLDRILLLWCS